MLLWRVGTYVRNAFVHREDGTAFVSDRTQQDLIHCAGQPFLVYARCLVANSVEVIQQLGWKVLIELDFHAERSGNIASSRASSAA